MMGTINFHKCVLAANWPKLPTEENMSLESFPSLEMAQRVTKVKDKNIRNKSFFKITLRAYHCNQNQIQK